MYAEIKEMLKYSICKFTQSPFSVKPYSEKLLDSCAICIKYHDQQVTKNALQEVIREAGEECKAQIDDLVRNAIETLESSNYKPDIPKLMRIKCPECNEHSNLLGEYEVGSVLFGIAYDSGGVTTSTVTVPLVAALGIGLANSIRGREPMIDGFGLIAFASLTPMIFVMAYGMLI